MVTQHFITHQERTMVRCIVHFIICSLQDSHVRTNPQPSDTAYFPFQTKITRTLRHCVEFLHQKLRPSIPGFSQHEQTTNPKGSRIPMHEFIIRPMHATPMLHCCCTMYLSTELLTAKVTRQGCRNGKNSLAHSFTRSSDSISPVFTCQINQLVRRQDCRKHSLQEVVVNC